MNGVPDPLQKRILSVLGDDPRQIVASNPGEPPEGARWHALSATLDGVFMGPTGLFTTPQSTLSEALSGVIRRFHEAHVPVVLVCHSPTDSQVAEALDAGAREVLDLDGPESIFEARLKRSMGDRALGATARRAEEVEAFISAASHDMKSPLRAITRYASLILEDEALLSEDARHMITRMQINAERLSDLVGDLIRVVQVGRIDLRAEQCPLREVLVVARRHLQDAISQAGATVEIGESLPTVVGDFDRLVDLFENLIGNAVKYRRPEAPCWVEITALSSEAGAHIAIRDNGRGIPRDELERVFGMFYRGHHRSVEGSGLGLAIVRRIAERHGGRVWAESVEGEGSTFHFRLPPEQVLTESVRNT